MPQYRKAGIIIINAIILGWLLKVIISDGNSDMAGTFSLLTLFFLLAYDGYAFILYKLYFKNETKNISIETGFFLLLLLPIILLWYFTS